MKICTLGAEMFHANAQTPMTQHLIISIFFPRKKEYILCLHIPLHFRSKSNPNMTKREKCCFNKNLFSYKILSISNFHSLELKKCSITVSYPAQSRWGTYHGCCVRRNEARTSVKTSLAGRTHSQ